MRARLLGPEAGSSVLSLSLGGKWLGMGLLAVGLVSGIALAWFHTHDFLHRLLPFIFLGMGFLLLYLNRFFYKEKFHTKVVEERLALVTEGTGIGVFDLDLRKQTVFASPALLNLFGIPVTAQDINFSAIQQYLPENFLNECIAFFWIKAAEGRIAYEHETSIPAADHGNTGLLIRARIERSKGYPIRLYGACLDITERKVIDSQLISTQHKLNQQLSDLGHLHELSTQLLEIPDLKTQLKTILSTLVQFHGAAMGLISLYDIRKNQLKIGANVGIDLKLLSQVSRFGGTNACIDACLEKSRIIIEDTESSSQFHACRDIALSLGFRAIHCTPLISHQGEVLGTLSIFLPDPRRPTLRECTLADICARKAVLFIERDRAQKDLEDSQGRFEAVLDASGAPFIILEPVRKKREIVNFRWKYINRAAARAFGQLPSELMKHEVLETLSYMSAGSPEFYHCIKVIETQRTSEFDTAYVQGEKTRWFHCIASPIHGGIAIWFADISERIRNEQLLRHSDKRKDEFLATLAHELRNPLAPIQQAAQLLVAAPVTDTQRQWASAVIDRQVKRMGALLDDLLDVPRISRGTLTLKKTLSSVSDIVASAVETALPNIEAKSHHLAVHNNAPSVVLEVDTLRIAQVIANLLNNAAKYTDSGGNIILQTRIHADELIIEVSDNGIGIPSESVSEVFHMFIQLHHTEDRIGGGLGIGLALSKGLIELHGGSISAHSAGLGKGSTFTLKLPVKSDIQSLSPITRFEEETPFETPSRKILIADDNQDALETLGALLIAEGHEVHHAHDGENALRIWHEQHPDVCLLDIGMPKMTGYEVARQIRASAEGSSTLLLALTGWGQSQDRQASLKAGFDHHLTKPVSPKQISQLLKKHSLQDASAPPSPLR